MQLVNVIYLFDTSSAGFLVLAAGNPLTRTGPVIAFLRVHVEDVKRKSSATEKQRIWCVQSIAVDCCVEQPVIPSALVFACARVRVCAFVCSGSPASMWRGSVCLFIFFRFGRGGRAPRAFGEGGAAYNPAGQSLRRGLCEGSAQ